MDNPFRVLGISPDLVRRLSDDKLQMVIDSQYKVLQRIFHPDTGGNTRVSTELNEARDLLDISTNPGAYLEYKSKYLKHKPKELVIAEYKKQQKAMALPLQAVARLEKLREQIPAERILIISGDGAYTNRTICRRLPPSTVFLGRIRKDAKLFATPDESPARGRRRIYGQQLQTPEEIRSDDQAEWKEVKAATGDKTHTFKVKSIKMVRSKIVGEQDLKLIIVQPLRYRLSAKSKLLYREPAYIISTDPDLDDEKILQWYLWRWEIELNFRDEKNIFGIDEAMVRTKNAVETLPPFIASSYAMLLLAGSKAIGEDKTKLIVPKWRKPNSISRPSTNHYLSTMRQEIFQMNAENNFEGFGDNHAQFLNTFLFTPNIQSAIISAAS